MIKNGVYTIRDEFYNIFTDEALTHNDENIDMLGGE